MLHKVLFASTQFRGIRSWLNFVYRKIFNYNKLESVGQLIFKFKTSYYCLRTAKLNYLLYSSNLVLRFINLSGLISAQNFQVKNCIDLCSNNACIQRTVINGFKH
jgi:hypothetical protein